MTPRTAFAVAFLIAQALALTWPVATRVNEPGIHLLGLPLPFAWSVLWVVATFGVMATLWWRDRRAESAPRDRGGDA